MRARATTATALVGVGVLVALVSGYAMPPSNLLERVTIGTAVGSQMLPVAALATLGPPLPRARYWLGVWFLLALLSDFIQLAISSVPGASNLWFMNSAQVFEDVILLWALSFWQVTPIMRLSFRLGIPLFAGVALTVAYVAGETTITQSVTGPFRCLVMMSAFSYTLIANLREESELALSRDWLWGSIGFTLYFGMLLIVPPVSASLYPDNIALARLVYTIKAMINVVAFLLIARGLMCPIPARSSGRI
jgi:hypothetical protein